MTTSFVKYDDVWSGASASAETGVSSLVFDLLGLQPCLQRVVSRQHTPSSQPSRDDGLCRFSAPDIRELALSASFPAADSDMPCGLAASRGSTAVIIDLSFSFAEAQTSPCNARLALFISILPPLVSPSQFKIPLPSLHSHGRLLPSTNCSSPGHVVFRGRARGATRE